MNINEKACGCIIVDNGKVLLIKQLSKAWGFPKGHVEHDESEEDTAIREVKEETNIDVEIDNTKRYTMEYITDKGRHKEIVLFLAKKIGGELRKQDSEILEAKWLSFSEAIDTISYENTRELFIKVLKENKFLI